MPEVELFPIPDVEFSSASDFHKYLAENYDPSTVDHHLTIVLGLTEYTKSMLEDRLTAFGFTVERRLGAVLHLQVPVEESTLECYLTVDEPTGVLAFYTNFRKTEEVPKIHEFLRTDPSSHRLFLRPVLMREILESMIERYEDIEIHEFHAFRPLDSKWEAKVRPRYKRSISYWGRDGRETLDEIGLQYGVLPAKVRLYIPTSATKFKIDKDGAFTFETGDLSILFENMERAINESRRTMEAYNGSAFRMLPVETARKAFEVPSSTPAVIELSTEVSLRLMEDMQEQMEESGFIVLASLEQEGSLFVRIDIQSESGHRFRVKAFSDQIKIFPQEDKTLSDFMRFYEVVLETVDPEAELVVA